MADKKSGMSPLDELRKVNEMVASSNDTKSKPAPAVQEKKVITPTSSASVYPSRPTGATAPKPQPKTNRAAPVQPRTQSGSQANPQAPAQTGVQHNPQTPSHTVTRGSAQVKSQTAPKPSGDTVPVKSSVPTEEATEESYASVSDEFDEISEMFARRRRSAQVQKSPSAELRTDQNRARPTSDKTPGRAPSQSKTASSGTATPVTAPPTRTDLTSTRVISREEADTLSLNRSTPKKSSSPSASKKEESKKDENNYSSEFEETVGKGVVSSAVKAVIYLVCVLVISGCLALVTIVIANDAFAFVKTGEEVTVTLNENSSLSDIADLLSDNNIIKYPSIFKLYCKFRHKTSDNYLSGEFTVSPTMGYDALIAKFLPSGTSRKEITITLIEGMNVDQIIDTFIENGIGTKEKFVDVIQNYEFDYWFVDELNAKLAANPDSGRKYRLEGYLFPDTYNFYNTASEVDVIDKLLDNFNNKFDESMRQRAQSMGYTTDQIIILASMIQKEAKYVSDYGNVSSVFYNRLNKGQNLESNATVQYMMPESEVELKLTYDQIQQYDSAYNTYLHGGLPVGPICNPSLNAFNWALYPADTDYYYFVSDSAGYNLFASTYREHEKNIAQVEAEGDGQ